MDKQKIIKDFENKGYQVISDFKSANDKILVQKNGYKAFITYNNFKYGKNPSFFGFHNIFQKENMEHFILIKDPKVDIIKMENIVKSKRKRVLITYKCKCGNIYKKTWDDTVKSKYLMCTKCYRKKKGINSRKNRTKTITTINKFGYNLVNTKQEFTRNEKIEVYNLQGYRGFISYNKIVHGQNMSIFNMNTNKSNFIYNANHYCDLNGIGTKVISFSDQKKWTRQGIKCKCSCGNIFETSIYSFLSGKTRCDICSRSISKYEYMVKQFLDDIEVEYIYQFRINSCKDILSLPFDFYIKKNIGLIEVDGEGHYKPCNFNNMSNDKAYKNYCMTKKHDKIKTEYCEKWQIPLLRIPYWDINNGKYKESIMQFIKK